MKALCVLALALALMVPAAAVSAAPAGYVEHQAAAAMRDAWRRTPTDDRIDVCRQFYRHNSAVIGYLSRMLVNRAGADRAWSRAFIYRFLTDRCLRYGF